MKEIKKTYLLSREEYEKISDYATGLVVVTTDDEIYYQCSTDMIVPFTKAESEKASKIREFVKKYTNQPLSKHK